MSNSLAVLLNAGVPLDEIERIKNQGASIDEMAQSIISIQARGESTERCWEPPIEADPLFECFKTLDEFSEEEATWTVPGWIPEGQITLLAADGGIGKTTLWVNIIASMSSGQPCVLDPQGHTREPQKVAFLTTEDSVRKKLKRKLREAGANMSNIVTLDFAADKDGVLRDLKFGSRKLEQFIKYYRPALCVFDPVQGFIPRHTNMGSRNEMRDCLSQLITLGEETGTTFLVICHTNKRKAAFGRDRVADSADLWDISRSVLMAGYTETHGVRYLSNEKNNYTTEQETLLFTINDNGQIVAEGTTWKKDRDYAQESAVNASAPKREDCKAWILNELDGSGGTIATKELDDRAKAAGYAYRTLRRAKEELKTDGAIRNTSTGNSKSKVWYIERVYPQDFIKMPDDTPTPWDG